MTIELYDLAGADDALRFSPYCWRARLALAHKNLSCEAVPWRFTEKDHIAFSGQALVPVIRDDDKVVNDSWAIALYLDERYPDRPRLFEGPQALALTSLLRHWTERVLHPLLLKVIIPDVFKSLHEKDKAYFRESREKRFGVALEDFAVPSDIGIAELRRALAPLRAALEAQPFIAGKAPAFADYVVFGAFQWARTVSPLALVADDDPVGTWCERMLDLYGGLARNAMRRAA